MTAVVLRDGRIRMGVRCREDAEGFCIFEGRADNVAKVSARWVTPVEDERCLAGHSAVLECAVLAVEDARRITTLEA